MKLELMVELQQSSMEILYTYTLATIIILLNAKNRDFPTEPYVVNYTGTTIIY